ncbi:MAG: glycosyltransferase [Verrucomicrobiota bacterium]
MKVLILTLGSRGDVQPYVALGAALRDRGHAITVSTGAGFEDLINLYGLTAAPLSTNVRELMRDPAVQKAFRSLTGKFAAWRKYRNTFRTQLSEWWAIAREVRPDVLVFHPKGAAAMHLAEKLRVPAIPAVVVPGLVATREYPTIISPRASLGAFGNQQSHRLLLWLTRQATSGAFNQWRRDELELPPMSHRDPYGFYHPNGRPGPRLHGYSAQLQPKPGDWAEHEHVTGYWHLDQASGWRPSPELKAFLETGPAPIFVSFGSMPTDNPAALTRTVLAALKATGQRGVLGLAWGGLQKIEAPEGVFFLEEAAYDGLFPRCAAVVHHGGSGTTHEGLRWGRPTVVCPVLLDQPYWGRRVHAIGAGPGPLPLRRHTAASLATAITEALRAEVAARAAQIGEAMRREPGAAEAARLVEETALSATKS